MKVVITYPNYPGTITRKGLGKPSAHFYDVPADAPIRTRTDWRNQWERVWIDGVELG